MLYYYLQNREKRLHFTLTIVADTVSQSRQTTTARHVLTISQGRSQAAPLTAWLRVPLSAFQSYTTSFFPDETHSDIRRTFTPEDEPYAKRNFCGYCGTHLTYWTEQPSSESDFLSVTVGSLRGEDLRNLEELGLLSEDAPTSSISSQVPDSSSNGTINRTETQGTTDGLPWFEEMIEGSRLGRVSKIRRGVGRSADGSTTVEWEVTEWTDDGSGIEQGGGTGKRKLGALGGDISNADVEMR